MTSVVSDVRHRKRELRFEKSHLVEFCRRKKRVDFRLLAEAWRRMRVWWWWWWWGRWKSQHRNSVHLSLCQKPLNSKVIKRFVTKLRSRKCFFVFRDSYVIYIRVLNILCKYVRVGVCAYIYIYIYMCVCVCVFVIEFWRCKIVIYSVHCTCC